MAEWCGPYGVDVRGYCLMPNQVHLIVAPSSEQGPAKAIGQAHVKGERMTGSCGSSHCCMWWVTGVSFRPRRQGENRRSSCVSMSARAVHWEARAS
jgi:REP element-mobilizing transposase RayT